MFSEKIFATPMQHTNFNVHSTYYYIEAALLMYICDTVVAKRVAEERGERLGKSVGFQIRLENQLPEQSGSILYCTTGILLRRMINDP